MARRTGDVTVPPAARTRARKLPFRGDTLKPSTEILEREFPRASQRTRSVAATVVALAVARVACPAVAEVDAAVGAVVSLPQAARAPARITAVRRGAR